MFIGQSREQLRQLYVDSWQKYLAQAPLEPLEKLIASVVAEHPEYHVLLKNADAAPGRDYLPEMGATNPFLHMGMHVALREQLASNRPGGIAGIYQKLLGKYRDTHEAEHRMAECLGETMWRAQRENKLPDEAAYLTCLRRL